MKFRSLLLSLMAIAIVGATSCKKDDDDDDDNTPTVVKALKKSTNVMLGDTTTTTYEYAPNSTQVVKMIETEQNYVVVKVLTYQNNKVTEVMEYDDEAMTNAVSKVVYTYSGNELARSYTIQLMSSDTSYTNYEYSNGKLTKVILKEYFSTELSITEYAWNGNNVISEKHLTQSNPSATPVLTDQIDYLHDTKVSPYANHSHPEFDGMIISANNPIGGQMKDDSGSVIGTITVAYTYDGDLPTNGNITGSFGIFPISGVILYEYIDVEI